MLVCWNIVGGLDWAATLRHWRWASLLKDSRRSGLSCYLETPEVGTRDSLVLAFLCHPTGVSMVRQVQSKSSQLALLGSRVIYDARDIVEGSGGDFLKRWFLSPEASPAAIVIHCLTLANIWILNMFSTSDIYWSNKGVDNISLIIMITSNIYLENLILISK